MHFLNAEHFDEAVSKLHRMENTDIFFVNKGFREVSICDQTLSRRIAPEIH